MCLLEALQKSVGRVWRRQERKNIARFLKLFSRPCRTMQRMSTPRRNHYLHRRMFEEKYLLDADFDDKAAPTTMDEIDVDALIEAEGLVLKRKRGGARPNAGRRPKRSQPPAIEKRKPTPR